MLACEPSRSLPLPIFDIEGVGFERNLPQSTRGANVITTPEANHQLEKVPPRSSFASYGRIVIIGSIGYE
jgi:hypothetical protein